MRFILLSLIFLVACRPPPRPTYDYRIGDVLLEEDFDASFAWEAYENPDFGVSLRVDDGAYRMTVQRSGYIWGLNAVAHENVVIETQTTQRSDEDNNAYGIMCRADPSNNGEGYYFLISGDGYWSIRRGTGDGAQPLIEFEESDVIRTGRSVNTVRALCVEDYLALYVNGEFVGEAHDELYARGFAGLVVATPNDAPVEVSFDYVDITEAELIR